MRRILAVICISVLFGGYLCLSQSNPPLTPVAPTISPQPTILSHDTYDKWNLVFAGATAIGSIAVAILAVFGQRIRGWLVRPRIFVRVGEESPCIEMLEEEDTSSAGAKRTLHHIRLEVTNSGWEIARNCMVLCNSVYRQRPGSGFFTSLENLFQSNFTGQHGNKDSMLPQKSHHMSILPKYPNLPLL